MNFAFDLKFSKGVRDLTGLHTFLLTVRLERFYSSSPEGSMTTGFPGGFEFAVKSRSTELG